MITQNDALNDWPSIYYQQVLISRLLQFLPSTLPSGVPKQSPLNMNLSFKSMTLILPMLKNNSPMSSIWSLKIGNFAVKPINNESYSAELSSIGIEVILI